jgi:uncharacterized protein YecE (DUF72 family)
MTTKSTAKAKTGAIRVGIGGWTYEPWRDEFYPEGLAHSRELAYASSQLPTIEINGTFYRTQTPAVFAAWAAETPDGFMFSVKAPRYATHLRELASAEPHIIRFLKSGLTELGDRLGPLLWQFPPTKRFDDTDFARFLDLLPPSLHGCRLRHALDVRHESFATPTFVALARRAGAAIVYTDHATYPSIPDITADFVYARLQKGQERLKTGYTASELDALVGRLRAWAAGSMPDDLTAIDAEAKPQRGPRDVFAYVIHEAKVRAPAAARALTERLG